MYSAQLKTIKQQVEFTLKYWQQQQASILEHQVVNQKVERIYQNLYSINDNAAKQIADWLKQKIEQAPKDSLAQGTVYFKRNITTIFEQLWDQLNQLIYIPDFSPYSYQNTANQGNSSYFSKNSTNHYSKNNTDYYYTNHTNRHSTNNTVSSAGFAANNFHPPKSKPFSQIDPKLQNIIKSRGGGCSASEAAKRYEKIPVNVRQQGDQAVREYLDARHWSHRISKANGGNNSPINGDWELAGTNWSRGSKNMNLKEILDVSVVQKVQQNFKYYRPVIIQNSLKAGGMAFLCEAGFSGLENFVAVQRGEKTLEQGVQDTVTQSIGAGVIASVIMGGMSVIAITPVVSPLAIGAATIAAPPLTIVATASYAKRLLNLFSNTPNLDGMEKLQLLMESYGLDETEMAFRDLEADHELEQLKLQML
ncbi:hypothetical protein PN462_13495 [Spirulina sp. CS-785/01]|nr:hypothetical protein [Spirulina sp. CS-785/01]